MQITQTEGKLFLEQYPAAELAQEFGTPLYVYSEKKLRQQCAKIRQFCSLPNFKVAYSAKANSSLALLTIIAQENLGIEVVSLGELLLAQTAGFKNQDIFFLSNNFPLDDYRPLVSSNIQVCLDSLIELENFCRLYPCSQVSIRLNPEHGAGHHKKVITAGRVKFGIEWGATEQAFAVAKKFACKIRGLVVHIGSSFAEKEFHQHAVALLKQAENFPDLEYLDFGGGFCIAYNPVSEPDFPVEQYSETFTTLLTEWMQKNQRQPLFGIQPGRFITANCGVCLAKVMSKKSSHGEQFVGTDLGFNALLRPTMYNAYHQVINASRVTENLEKYTVVGNICEAGDILGQNLSLPIETQVGDLMLVKDTGAYGFSMSSNYNSIPRPAEILLKKDGQPKLIRERENLQYLLTGQIL